MADHGSNTRAPSEFAAWLGGLLMTLVTGEDLRVRKAIARAVTRARPDDRLDLKTPWHARHDLAADPRVE
ncbi:hypothetical protein [Bradyrhizobium sp.]|uniref:hypothetical protein n=1 Tax=Bradyrhizobium sp. TaxID=376 RepID=UPI003C7367ED